MSQCLPFVFYFSHLHHRHVWKFWIISRRWAHQTKRLPFLLINYYFSSLGNSKFSWICSGEDKKMFATTDKFHNHSKEMTSSSWEQFLLLSEIWGEKYHLFLSPNHKQNEWHHSSTTGIGTICSIKRAVFSLPAQRGQSCAGLLRKE